MTMISDGQPVPAEDDLELDDELMAAIAAAEAAVGDMASDYPEMLLQDIGLLTGAIARLDLHAPGTDEHATACIDCFGVLHDIKGQAASFGYEKATDLCDPLCECVRGQHSVSTQLIGQLKQAVDILSRMAAEGVSADTDNAALALIRELPDA